MQFSLKTLLVGMLVVSVALVIPRIFLWSIECVAWCLLPSALVAYIRYGAPEQRVFAVGSLTAYLALALQHQELAEQSFAVRWAVVAVALSLGGWLTIWLQQRLCGRDDPPIVPPPAPR